MFSYKVELVKQLDTILPTYDEFFVDSEKKTPCFTYLELSNVANQEGDTLRYSTLNYRISLWGSMDDELEQYIPQLDSLMYSLGFRRRAYTELNEDLLQRRIFTYEGIGLEIV